MAHLKGIRSKDVRHSETQGSRFRSMPDAAADSGLSAFDTSIHAQTLSAFVICAKNERARVVLPEHSAPIISVTAPIRRSAYR
jgi:hypothetical protein